MSEGCIMVTCEPGTLGKGKVPEAGQLEVLQGCPGMRHACCIIERKCVASVA